MLGITTNRDLLIDVLDHEAFTRGQLDTHFLGDHFAQWRGAVHGAGSTGGLRTAMIASALVDIDDRLQRAEMPSLPVAFRNNHVLPQRLRYRHAEQEHVLSYRASKGAFDFVVEGAAHRAKLLDRNGKACWLELDGLRTWVRLARDGARVHCHVDGMQFFFERVPRYPTVEPKVPTGACTAPMPGKVVRVDVAEAQLVEAGQTLMVLEAMKMEQRIVATHAGRVTSLHAAPGDQVEANTVLAVISEPSTS